MDNYKLRQIMAGKNRARTTQEQEAMASLLAKLRAKREEATGVNEPGTPMAQPKNPQKEID